MFVFLYTRRGHQFPSAMSSVGSRGTHMFSYCGHVAGSGTGRRTAVYGRSSSYSRFVRGMYAARCGSRGRMLACSLARGPR